MATLDVRLGTGAGTPTNPLLQRAERASAPDDKATDKADDKADAEIKERLRQDTVSLSEGGQKIVNLNRGQASRHVGFQLNVFLLKLAAQACNSSFHQAKHRHGAWVQLKGTGFDPAEFLQISDQPLQSVSFAVDLLEGGSVRGQHTVNQSLH